MYCIAHAARSPNWPANGTVDVRGEKETWQPIHTVSCDKLASETSEEVEARLISLAARV